MSNTELLEALRAMRHLGETLSETARDYHRVLVELEDVREGMADLDRKIASIAYASRVPDDKGNALVDFGDGTFGVRMADGTWRELRER